MVERRRGRIINVASDAGAFRWPLVSHYSVAKAALIKLTENLAVEARRHGIAAFAIHPGLLRIGLTERSLNAQPTPTQPTANPLDDTEDLGSLVTPAEAPADPDRPPA